MAEEKMSRQAFENRSCARTEVSHLQGYKENYSRSLAMNCGMANAFRTCLNKYENCAISRPSVFTLFSANKLDVVRVQQWYFR